MVIKKLKQDPQYGWVNRKTYVMEININKVSQEVVDYFYEDFKLELDMINYGHIEVYEDDVDTEEYLMQPFEFYGELYINHCTYKGQDYIVILVDPQD
jgi:hypothetical protein